ncbi:hypothetical protein Gohar_017690, partial [Gossypium harknessii]|nr:hypothetical protein [Gossypium harknessii]
MDTKCNEKRRFTVKVGVQNPGGMAGRHA